MFGHGSWTFYDHPNKFTMNLVKKGKYVDHVCLSKFWALFFLIYNNFSRAYSPSTFLVELARTARLQRGLLYINSSLTQLKRDPTPSSRVDDVGSSLQLRNS